MGPIDAYAVDLPDLDVSTPSDAFYYAAPSDASLATLSDADRDYLSYLAQIVLGAAAGDLEMEGDENELVEDPMSYYFLRGLCSLLVGDNAFLGPSFYQEAVSADEDIVPFEEFDSGFDSEPFALDASDGMANVISYDVVVNGSNYVLYLSPDDLDRLYIDGDGYLWNVGTSNVSGRLFSGTFNPRATTGIVVTLGPCLGNTFSNNRNYGSPNYMRNYYWSGSNLSSTTTYITIHVEETRYPFQVSQTLVYVVIILLGGILLCLWKRSSR